jgi:peroxiredoxin
MRIPACVDRAGRLSNHAKGGSSMAVTFGRKSVASETRTLKTGDQAPDFELKGHRNGEKFHLGDARGKKNVVLVFYPLDWTPV